MITNSAGRAEPSMRAERRWPMAAAVTIAGLLFELLPADFQMFPDQSFVYPVFLAVFLVVLIAGDPGRIDRQRRWLRITTGLMIATITLVTAVQAVRLVVGILTDASFDSAGQLLAIGGIIWVSNVIAYALWFWDLDGEVPPLEPPGTPPCPGRSCFRSTHCLTSYPQAGTHSSWTTWRFRSTRLSPSAPPMFRRSGRGRRS